VAVDRLINLRSDGQKVLLALKLERPARERARSGTCIASMPDANGVRRYGAKH
jgi:hypothetical protein